MTKSLSTFAAAGALLISLSAPAAAQNSQSTPRDRGAADRAERPDRQICVQYELVGSRIPKRDCRTRREWIELEGAVPEGEQR